MKAGSFLNSSIGKKITMSLTGLFLSVFLIVHAIGNLQLFAGDEGLSFNTYAAFMGSNIFIEIVSWGLYVIIVYHILRGLLLWYENYKSRPVRYAVSRPQANSTWYSRYMGWLGVLILVFLVIHLANFWYPYKVKNVTPYSQYEVSIFDPHYIKKTVDVSLPEGITTKRAEFVHPQDGVKVIFIRDMYREVKYTFENELWIVILYVLAMIVLAYHLIHGVKSAFQSLGVINPVCKSMIEWVAIGLFGIIIPATFAMMPIYFYVVKHFLS